MSNTTTGKEPDKTHPATRPKKKVEPPTVHAGVYHFDAYRITPNDDGTVRVEAIIANGSLVLLLQDGVEVTKEKVI